MIHQYKTTEISNSITNMSPDSHMKMEYKVVVGCRGLAVFIIAHGAKGRQFESRSLLFFFNSIQFNSIQKRKEDQLLLTMEAYS